MTSDEDLVAALQRLFAAHDPSDGIDRSDGYGEEYEITHLEVVTAEDGFDDLLVTVDQGDGTTLSASLLFDRAWREASGLDDASSYGAYVVARWRRSLVDDLAPSADAVHPEADHDLEEVLRGLYVNANRISHEVVEVVEEDGEIVLVHATPQEWHRFAAVRPDPVGALEEIIGSRWDDEQHVVFFRGGFHASIRGELPPVRSMLLRDAPVPDELV